MARIEAWPGLNPNHALAKCNCAHIIPPLDIVIDGLISIFHAIDMAPQPKGHRLTVAFRKLKNRVNICANRSFQQLSNYKMNWFTAMRKKLLTITAIAIISSMTAGCQLLIDNRKTGKASVVVVPTDQWDALRSQQIKVDAARDLTNEIATGLVDELRKNQLLVGGETANDPVRKNVATPIDGSQNIQFSNRTNSQLAGCSTIGIIEVLHTGTMDDAMVILKNEAYRLNTNILVPMAMKQSNLDIVASANIEIEARMMKCPLKLARGN